MPASIARGFLQMIGGVNAMVCAFATKIPLEQSFLIWNFNERELSAVEKPLARLTEKWLPMLEEYGDEVEVAGSLLPILMAKVFAVVAAKKLLESKSPIPPAGNAAPAKAAPTPIKPAPSMDRSSEAAAAATPQPQPTRTAAAPPAPRNTVELPSPFAETAIRAANGHSSLDETMQAIYS